MVKVATKPNWQWSGKNASEHSLNARPGNVAASVLKQTLMPRSLDLSFSLKYRR